MDKLRLLPGPIMKAKAYVPQSLVLCCTRDPEKRLFPKTTQSHCQGQGYRPGHSSKVDVLTFDEVPGPSLLRAWLFSAPFTVAIHFSIAEAIPHVACRERQTLTRNLGLVLLALSPKLAVDLLLPQALL